MSKTYNYVLALVAVSFMDLLYFLWLPYPKSALKTWGAPLYLQDLLADLIFFLIFFSVYTFSYMSIARPGTKARDSRGPRRKVVAILFVVHLALSWLMLQASILFYLEAYWIVCHLCTLLFWAFAARLMAGLIGRPGKGRRPAKGRLIAWCTLAAIVLTIFTMELLSGQRLSGLRERYYTDSQFFMALQANGIFSFQIRQALLDLSCAAVCLVCPLVYGAEDEVPYGRWARDFARGVGICFLVMVLYIVKLMLLPNNCLILPMVIDHQGRTMVDMPPEKRFDSAVEYETEISRGEYPYGQVIYRSSTDIDLWFNGQTLDRYFLEGALGWDEAPEGEISMLGYQNIDLGSAQAAVFASQWIFWTDQSGQIRSLKLEDLPQAPEDPVLTKLCRERIGHGDLRFFDYGLEYMLRCDSGFISPYIERYAQGRFTQPELSYILDYKPEYIQSLAQSCLQ